MVKKDLFISLALFGLLFSAMSRECFADAATQLEQAEAYKKNEQYEQAEAIYKTVVADYGGSDYALEAQKNLAILYINRAQAACERLITDFSSHPALPEALYRVADEYQILQSHERARQIYQYIVDNLPESDMAVPAQMDVVISNLELGKDAEAEAETRKLIVDFAGHPHLPDALCGVANEYQGRQRHERAIELYRYIADTLPESDMALPARMNVVISNLELGKDIEAQAATYKLVADFAVHPDLPDVLYHVANEYQGHQIHKQAQTLYKYIVDNLPKSEYVILSRCGIILSHIGLGNNAAAQAAIDRLILDFKIGIGGNLTAPFLPHHRAYGSVPRRFGQVKQCLERLSWGNRTIRSKHWRALVAQPRDATCATPQTKPQPQQQHERGGRLGDAIGRNDCAPSSIVAIPPYASADASMPAGCVTPVAFGSS